MTIWDGRVRFGDSDAERTCRDALGELSNVLTGLDVELAPLVADDARIYSEAKAIRLARDLAASAAVSDAMAPEKRELFEAFFYCTVRERTTTYVREYDGGPDNQRSRFIDIVEAAAVERDDDADRPYESKGQMRRGRTRVMPHFCMWPHDDLTYLYGVLAGDESHSLEGIFTVDNGRLVEGDAADEAREHLVELDEAATIEPDFDPPEEFLVSDEQQRWYEEQTDYLEEQKRTLKVRMPSSASYVIHYETLARRLPEFYGPGKADPEEFERLVTEMVLTYLRERDLAPVSDAVRLREITDRITALTAEVRPAAEASG